MSDYDNTNRGALFKPRAGEDTDSLAGTINVDGVDQRVVLVKRKSQSGKAYWELFTKAGAVFRSSSDNPKAPVIYGSLGDIDDPDKKIAGWKQDSPNVEGGSFYSLKIEDAEPQSNPQPASGRIDDDEIPF